jgi:hypothetical protein
MSKGLLTVQQFIQAQREDEALTDAHIKAANTGYLKFRYLKGVLCHYKANGMNRRPVLPSELYKQYLFSAHNNTTSGHKSARQIKAKIQESFFVQNHNTKAKSLEATCFHCRMHRPTRQREIPYLPNHMAIEPRQIWSVDYADRSVKAEEKATILKPEENDTNTEEKNQEPKAKRTTKNPDLYTGVLIFLDNASSFVVTIPIKSRRSSEFIELFEKHIINSYCTPKILRSDKRAIVSSIKVQNYFDILGIDQQPTATSSTWCNTQMASHVNKIKQLITTAHHQDAKQTWTTQLPLITTAHNHCPLRYTRTAKGVMTPEDLFFESSTAEHVQPKEHRNHKGTQAEENTNNVDPTAREIQKAATTRIEEHRTPEPDSANKHMKAKQFAANDIVWLKHTKIAWPRTLTQTLTGPHVITSVNQTTAGLKNLNTNKEREAHIRRLERVENMPEAWIHPCIVSQLAQSFMNPD